MTPSLSNPKCSLKSSKTTLTHMYCWPHFPFLSHLLFNFNHTISTWLPYYLSVYFKSPFVWVLASSLKCFHGIQFWVVFPSHLWYSLLPLQIYLVHFWCFIYTYKNRWLWNPHSHSKPTGHFSWDIIQAFHI